MQKGSQAHKQDKVLEALGSQRVACHPPGPPLSDSLTRVHCRLFYSLETTHYKTPQKPSQQVRTADPGPAVPTCRCRLYDAPPTSRSWHIRATGLGVRAMNSGQRQLCVRTGSLQGCTASGFHVTVRRGYRSTFTVPVGFMFVAWSPILSSLR